MWGLDLMASEGSQCQETWTGSWARAGEVKGNPGPSSDPAHTESLCLHTETGLGAICPCRVHATPVSWGPGWLR